MKRNSYAKFVVDITQSIMNHSEWLIVDYSIRYVDLCMLLHRNCLITHFEIKKYNGLAIIIMYFRFFGTENAMSFARIPRKQISISHRKVYTEFSKNTFYIVSTSSGYFTLNELQQIGIGGRLVIEIDC